MKHLNRKTAVIAALIALTLVLTGALTACGGKTTDPTTATDASTTDAPTTQMNVEDRNAKIEQFINEEENVQAIKELNDQFSSLYDISMKAEDGKLVYEFKLAEGLDSTADEFKRNVETGSNESYLTFRNALSDYTGFEDAVLVIRYSDSDGNTIYDHEITKDTQPNDAASEDYETVEEILEGTGILSELEEQSDEDTKITARAESDDTLALVYQLQGTYTDSELEKLKAEEQKYLDNNESIANLETMYTAINVMLPSKELKLRVVIEDLDGTVLAERVVTADDFIE